MTANVFSFQAMFLLSFECFLILILDSCQESSGSVLQHGDWPSTEELKDVDNYDPSYILLEIAGNFGDKAKALAELNTNNGMRTNHSSHTHILQNN